MAITGARVPETLVPGLREDHRAARQRCFRSGRSSWRRRCLGRTPPAPGAPTRRPSRCRRCRRSRSAPRPTTSTATPGTRSTTSTASSCPTPSSSSNRPWSRRRGLRRRESRQAAASRRRLPGRRHVRGDHGRHGRGAKQLMFSLDFVNAPIQTANFIRIVEGKTPPAAGRRRGGRGGGGGPGGRGGRARGAADRHHCGRQGRA